MTERLALLSAILANPDDDLPRLVFADWLEENGTTDADAARVEFIRLGCKSKAKLKITSAETKWLDANWQRLLENTVAARPSDTNPPAMSREGRFVRVQYRWKVSSVTRVAELVFEYVRGFARRVEYLQGHSYQRFWQAAASDEPLAYHRPQMRPVVEFNPARGGAFARLLPSSWGENVCQRAVGFTEEEQSVRQVGLTQETASVKVYAPLTRGAVDPLLFHPLAVTDEHDLAPGQNRLRAAVATAMTAIAREFVRLAEPTPGV